MRQRVSLCFAVGGVAVLLTAVVWLALLMPGRVMAERAPGTDLPGALQASADWLVSNHQNEDGGYTSFSTGADLADSDVGGTVDALLALASAGAEVAPPLAYLVDQPDAVADYAGQNGGTAGKLVLALALSGADPRDFAGHNLVLSVTSHLSPSGQFGVNTSFEQALAMMGLATAGETVPVSATNWLLEQQVVEGDLAGSWDDGYGTLGNPDATGMAILALLASGQAVIEPVQSAVDFLARTQLSSGGWEYGADFGESANSTALALQALLASGQDVFTAGGPWQPEGGKTPVEALLSWQSESGAFQADFGQGRLDDFFATVQSLPALGLAANLAPEPQPTEAPVQTATAVTSPTSIPTDAPAEPSTTPPPAATPEQEPTTMPEPTATAVEESVTDAPAVAGGDSPLPYIIIAVALVLVIGAGLWYLRGR